MAAHHHRLAESGPATGHPPDPWPGNTVMLRHYPNGLVAATSQNRVAVGATEQEALRRLALLTLDSPASPDPGALADSPLTQPEPLTSESLWSLEADVLILAKEVARSIIERVARVVGDATGGVALRPDETADQSPKG